MEPTGNLTPEQSLMTDEHFLLNAMDLGTLMISSREKEGPNMPMLGSPVAADGINYSFAFQAKGATGKQSFFGLHVFAWL